MQQARFIIEDSGIKVGDRVCIVSTITLMPVDEYIATAMKTRLKCHSVLTYDAMAKVWNSPIRTGLY